MTTAEKHSPARPDSLERILAAATRLFAEQGFEGVTTRELAAAAGLNMATMHHHVGGKRQLYERVLARLFDEERSIVNPFLARIDEGMLRNRDALRDLLAELVDTLVDLMDRSPERARLYMRRWLEAQPAGDANERETLALYNALSAILERAKAAGTIRPDVEIGITLRGFDWLLNGYFVTGPLGDGSLIGDPHDAKNLAAFKRYLNEYVCLMLGL